MVQRSRRWHGVSFEAFVFLAAGSYVLLRSVWRQGVNPVALVPAVPLFGAAVLLIWRPDWTRWIMIGVLGVVIAVGVVMSLALGFSYTSAAAIAFGVLMIWFYARVDPSSAGAPNDEQDDLTASAPGGQLVSRVFSRIIECYGGDCDASEMPEEHRTVLLAYHALGLIGNGGFNYLFESSLKGDPHFELTGAAFDTIGAVAAADAFRAAFGMFPDGTPPADVDTRLQIYRSGAGARRQPIDSAFFEASDEVVARLEAYIRSDWEVFQNLPTPKAASDSGPPRESAQRQSRADRWPSTHLPHWARVAFAARCARHVLPLFRMHWPDAPSEHVDGLHAAIALVEASAAAGRAAKELDDAHLQTLMGAGAALTGLYGFPEEQPAPPDGNAAVAASAAAKVAEQAVQAAMSRPRDSGRFADIGLNFARDAAKDTRNIARAIDRDFQLLLRRAVERRWTDKTPVRPNEFEKRG